MVQNPELPKSNIQKMLNKMIKKKTQLKVRLNNLDKGQLSLEIREAILYK